MDFGGQPSHAPSDRIGGGRLRKIYRIYEKDLGDPAEHHDTDEHYD
jgi:hypothetical protein